MSERFDLDMLAALALPPLRPPMRPKATAAKFLAFAPLAAAIAFPTIALTG
jgi:hypothetical protein